MSTTESDELTQRIYKAMQIGYLSERHDAIKNLIANEVQAAVKPAVLGDGELEAWYRKYAEFGDSLGREDGTIGAIESKKNFEELEKIVSSQAAAAQERAEINLLQTIAAETDEEFSRQEVDNWIFAFGDRLRNRLMAVQPKEQQEGES